MRTMEEIVREYCIDEVAKQIYNQGFPAWDARKINAEIGWVISGEYRLNDGTFKDIVIPRLWLLNTSLEEAISRADKLKAQGA